MESKQLMKESFGQGKKETFARKYLSCFHSPCLSSHLCFGYDLPGQSFGVCELGSLQVKPSLKTPSRKCSPEVH